MAQPPLSTETTPTSIPNPSSSSSSSSSSSTPTSSPAPPISYAAQQNVNASGNSQQQQQQQQQQSHSGMNPNSAVNPPIPAQPPFHTHPPRPAAPSFSYNFPQSAPPAFTANQHRQSNTSMPDSATQDFSKVSSASSNLHPVPAPTSISAMPPCSDPNYRPTTLWMPTAPTFPVHPVMPGTPSTPGPPGFAKPVILPSNPAAPSTSTGFPSAAVPRQNMPTASDPNASHRGLPYPPIPSMVAPPQGYWLQPPQMSGVHRPPFHQYPAAFPGPFSFPARGGALPAVPVPDSQPPGVTPVGAASISAPAASSHLLRGTSGVQTEVISAHTDDKHKSNATVTQNEDAANDQLDAWTAHKTEAGIVYYYNALTGQSTYDKPAGFKGEAHQVAVQPTPVSMVDLPGTDWQLVSTSDGKKYYYNNRTKTSCWQIPNEVAELKKKQDSDVTKDHPTPVPNTTVLSERGSGMVTLNAPAITTGGRDAVASKPSIVQSSPSALDLIKKKLQESGAPVTSSSIPTPSVQPGSESNGSKATDSTAKSLQNDNSKDKQKDANGDANVSDTSSDSEDEDSGPSKEECINQFKEMLKERGVAPFSKWEKELPKIVFDPRFKAIPSYSARRSLFEHYVKNRAEEERKEKRAAQKAAVEGFKQLLDEASEDIDDKTDYHTFRKKWGNDSRFEALDRKEREHLLNERHKGKQTNQVMLAACGCLPISPVSARLLYATVHPKRMPPFKPSLLISVSRNLVHPTQQHESAGSRLMTDSRIHCGVLPLKKATEEKAQAIRDAAADSFKSMLKEQGEITFNSRWSRVKESLRDDPRYKSVKHEDRELLFNEYISELKAVEHAAERETRAKREEQDKLRERERELRKRKEREEHEMERVRLKIRRKEAVTSFQALLVERIKDPMASWTESKPKLEKDPQGRATNSDLDSADMEKLFRDHVKMLQERRARDFRALLAEFLTSEAASQETDDGKTVLNSWSTAKRLIKSDPRYNKVPSEDREALWRRYAEDMIRRQKSSHDSKEEKHTDARGRKSLESSKHPLESGRSHERR